MNCLVTLFDDDYFQAYGFIKNFCNTAGWEKKNDDDAGSFDELFCLKKTQERDGLF